MRSKTLAPYLLAAQSPLLSVIAGYAQAVSIATPWGGQPLWWLQMLSLAGLVLLLDRAASARQAALLGWLFATSWLCGTVWWLFISMHVYGGLAAPLAVLAIVALCGFLALYYAAACYFYKRFRLVAGANTARAAIVFAAVWVLAELARDSWFTGFPWGAGGYAHVDGPFSMFAGWIGVYGISVCSALAVALLCQGFKWLEYPAGLRKAAMMLFWITLPTFVLIFYLPPKNERTFVMPAWNESKQRGAMSKDEVLLRNQSAEEALRKSKPATLISLGTEIVLLQGNIPQGEKFDSTTGVKASLEWYQQQLSLSTATLVITPETAIPLLPRQLPDGYWDAIQKRYATGNQAALVGIPLGDFEKGYTNSVLGIKPNQTQPYQYDKHHLVPFGEFIPPLFKWFTQMMNIPLGDFNRGAVGQPSFEWAGQRWAPNICYEDLFGDELARRFVDEKTAPTVMVNVSNIGWFGNTVAIDQHLQISRMRALELGRPMVRATNTGATVIISHRGEVTHSLPRHTRGVLTGSVEGRQGLTPFAWWAGRFGLWPLWIFGMTILIAAFRIIRRKSEPAV
ncbi:MAG: apolipoprotein N-acyltransferase [Burkholderiales bacterium]|nr:MAG: apolipoprotein N-acyltransferase [Burkholderiales bacterium]